MGPSGVGGAEGSDEINYDGICDRNIRILHCTMSRREMDEILELGR